MGNPKEKGANIAMVNGEPLLWKADAGLVHLCDGATLWHKFPDTFIMWTLCGRHDVPARQHSTGKISDVTCQACIAAAKGDPKVVPFPS